MKKRKKILNMQRRRKIHPDALSKSSSLENGQTRYFVHDPMGMRLQQEPDGSWLFPVHDGLGSVRGVLDENLNQLESYQYTPPGIPMSAQGAPQTPYGFTGEMTDPNGLVYLRNRYYNPNLGTFISADPIEGNINDLMSLNHYAYVQGNPINLVDHNGMCASSNEDSLIQQASANQCEQLRSELQSWGVQVDYNNNAPPPCVEDLVLRNFYFADTNLRWTSGEMSSLHAAFQIYRAAHTAIPIDNRWPININPPIHIVKKAYIHGDECSVGKRTGNIITLSEREWGETTSQYESQGRCSSPYVKANLDTQARSWWVLHEFSHHLEDELLKLQVPDWASEKSNLMTELTRLFSARPTEYSYSAADASLGLERLTEAVTATLWEKGYNAVARYNRDADEWTAGSTTTTANGNMLTNISKISSGNTTRFNGSLEDWIICKVLNPSLCQT